MSSKEELLKSKEELKVLEEKAKQEKKDQIETIKKEKKIFDKKIRLFKKKLKRFMHKVKKSPMECKLDALTIIDIIKDIEALGIKHFKNKDRLEFKKVKKTFDVYLYNLTEMEKLNK